MRNFGVFSLSAVDLFASAMGAFIIITIILMPDYQKEVRLEGHLEQAHALLSRPDDKPLGKRLEFLLQEIHREINTVNSKSADLELSRHALDLKAETEKVREQIQNVE